MKIIFVDGYNVLNNWPELKEKSEYSFEIARQKLIDIMHNYGTFNNVKVIIVFDAYKVLGNTEEKEIINKNLSIVFTKYGETADSYIEKEIHNLGRKYEVYVVTSDSLEQQTVFQRGAIRMSSLEFHNEVIKTQSSIKKIKEDSVSNKNYLQDNLKSNILEKLEKIRRSNE